ncbi:MAG: ATP-binding cassette domain-containing protein [Myxococcota bacterium]
MAEPSDRLTLRGLRIDHRGRTLVDGVSLDWAVGSVVGLVGSSGSGKTLTCRALVGMVDLDPGVVAGVLGVHLGPVVHQPQLGGTRAARDRAFRPLRGAVVGYLPQDAPATLDPFARIGAQVASAARLGRVDADPQRWLIDAGFSPSDAARVAAGWPHQLSGGMAQRVGIALALARGSRLLIADEPVTGLDAPLQRRVLRELRALADRGVGVLLVTHGLRALIDLADQVVVMDAGRVVETLTPGALRAGIAASGPAQRLVAAGIGPRVAR